MCELKFHKNDLSHHLLIIYHISPIWLLNYFVLFLFMAQINHCIHAEFRRTYTYIPRCRGRDWSPLHILWPALPCQRVPRERRALSSTKHLHFSTATRVSICWEKLSQRGGKRTAGIHVAPVYSQSCVLRRRRDFYPFSVAIENSLALGNVLVESNIWVATIKRLFTSTCGSTAGEFCQQAGYCREP